MKLILFLSLLTLPAFANRPPASQTPPTPAQRHAELLRRFDADGDGVLSPEERAVAAETLRREYQATRNRKEAAIQEHQQVLDAKREISLLQRFDTDRDGVLSPAERRVAEETLRRERLAFEAERRAP